MYDDHLTDNARKAMALANREAFRRNHESVGTDYILLGLVKVTPSIAAWTLEALGVKPEEVGKALQYRMHTGPEMATMGQKPRLTIRAESVVRQAEAEASSLGDRFIGTEHLLLALIKVGDGVAFDTLSKLGVEEKTTREVVLFLRSLQTQGAGQLPMPTILAKSGHLFLAKLRSSLLALDGNSRTLRMILEFAQLRAQLSGRQFIDSRDLLLAIFLSSSCDGEKLLSALNDSIAARSSLLGWAIQRVESTTHIRIFDWELSSEAWELLKAAISLAGLEDPLGTDDIIRAWSWTQSGRQALLAAGFDCDSVRRAKVR